MKKLFFLVTQVSGRQQAGQVVQMCSGSPGNGVQLVLLPSHKGVVLEKEDLPADVMLACHGRDMARLRAGSYDCGLREGNTLVFPKSSDNHIVSIGYGYSPLPEKLRELYTSCETGVVSGVYLQEVPFSVVAAAMMALARIASRDSVEA